MRKNLILGGALVLLIILAYVYQGPLRKWQNDLALEKNFMAKVDIVKISKIEIKKDGTTQSFLKKDGQWILERSKGLVGNGDLLNGLVSEIASAGKLPLLVVSANKDKKKEFKTDDSGISVRLFDGDNQMVDMVIGKDSSDFVSTYVAGVAGPDSDKTYSVKVNLNKYISSDLRDNKIFSSDKDKITKIRFQYPKSSFAIEKLNGKWSGVTPWKFAVGAEKIQKILGVMTSLRAVEIPEQKFESTGLEKHLIIVQATGDGIDNTIMLGDNNGKGYFYAKRGDSDAIYLISKNDRDALETTIDKLK